MTNVAASTAAGNITYQDADAVTVANVASNGNYVANAATTGITSAAGNGNVDVKNGAGTLTITNDILAGTGNVYLTTGANIAEAGTAKIVGTNLGMTAATGISANSATNNVTNVAASTAAGNVTYQDADAVAIKNVASNGNYVGNAATTGITTGAGNGYVDVKNGAGTLTITNDVLAGTGNVYLTSGADISEAATAKIIGTSLGMTAATGINANSTTNNVTNVAASTAAGNITYQDADALTVVNVASNGNYVANAATTGITTGAGNGSVDLKNGGALTITNDILAGAAAATAGNVYITTTSTVTEATTAKIVAGSLGINAAGTISANSATNDAVTLAAKTTAGTITYQDANALTVGTVAAAGNFTGATGVSTAGGAADTIDLKTGGALTIANDINAGTATTGSTVYLTVAGTVTETGTGKITAKTLGINAAGTVLANNANNVTNLGAMTTAGNISFNDVDALTLAPVAANTPAGNFTGVTGVTTPGNLTVVADQALDNAANTVIAVTGNASLTSTNSTINIGNATGDSFNAGTLTFNSKASTNITEDSDTNLSASSKADSLILTSAGSIENRLNVSSVTVTNNAKFTASPTVASTIKLGNLITNGNQPSTDSSHPVQFGSLTFSASGDVVISEAGSMLVTGVNNAGTVANKGNLVLAATGNINSFDPGTTISVTGTLAQLLAGGVIGSKTTDTLEVGEPSVNGTPRNILSVAYNPFGTLSAPGAFIQVQAGGVDVNSVSVDIIGTSKDGLLTLTPPNVPAGMVLFNGMSVTPYPFIKGIAPTAGPAALVTAYNSTLTANGDLLPPAAISTTDFYATGSFPTQQVRKQVTAGTNTIGMLNPLFTIVGLGLNADVEGLAAALQRQEDALAAKRKAAAAKP